MDTRHAAYESYCVKFEHGRFDTVDFSGVIEQIAASNNGLESVDFVYGSGFEAAPELLQLAAKHFTLVGNQVEALQQMKSPGAFFGWLKKLQIPHPEISFSALKSAKGWLQKLSGGSGGTHIEQAMQECIPKAGVYFQREVAGLPISLLFAADGERIQVIGFNLQWLAATENTPYRYGGAVSHWPLSKGIQLQLIGAAQKLTQAVGLRGLNSLDAMQHEEQLQVLEINPRLSASFDLYQSNGDQIKLFDLHVLACQGELMDWQASPCSRAHHIVYAPWDMQAPAEIFWPEWAADLPLPNSQIPAYHPICTVLALANDAKAARDLVLSRAESLIFMIKTLQGK